MKIGGIVLAAGGSLRMGRCKALLRLGGETLLARSIRAARGGGCSPVVVVAGSNLENVVAEAEAQGAIPVLNPGWSEGMSTSIAAGVARFSENPAVCAALLLGCDQPLVEGVDISRIIAAFRNLAPRAVASDYGNGACGIPALFSRDLFHDLLSLSGDTGARAIIERERTRTVFVEVPAGAVDVDTREEWNEVLDSRKISIAMISRSRHKL